MSADTMQGADVVGQWTGRHAAALQAATRKTNMQFAEWLGMHLRAVASWHAKPNSVLRQSTQEILDRAYEMSSDAVKARFALLIQQRSTPAEPPRLFLIPGGAA
ncbi:hypothetical protein ACFYOK_10865 [Microbispora bryophytorum]|uniref:hypothetical protein n=1 Tax=Microbispora bryophytorum TaxID=1460882 RepID=UPI003407E8D5